MQISPITRRHLVDELRLSGLAYNGSLSEIEFLERIYPLDEIPSTDGRPFYKNLRDDILQHRVRWPEDYGAEWIWTDERLRIMDGSDENILRFLCEMVHPLVRPDPKEVEVLLSIFNKHLRVDGYEIAQDGFQQRRPIYRPRALHSGVATVLDHAPAVPDLGEHVRLQVDRMRAAIHNDPGLAIGTAKELIESVSKTVLQQRGVAFDTSADAPRLARMALEAVAIVPPDWTGDERVAGSIRSLLGALTQVGTRLAELRNWAGSGHGREAGAAALAPMHARLACDSAATFAVFMVEAVRATPPISGS